MLYIVYSSHYFRKYKFEFNTCCVERIKMYVIKCFLKVFKLNPVGSVYIFTLYIIPISIPLPQPPAHFLKKFFHPRR